MLPARSYIHWMHTILSFTNISLHAHNFNTTTQSSLMKCMQVALTTNEHIINIVLLVNQ